MNKLLKNIFKLYKEAQVAKKAEIELIKEQWYKVEGYPLSLKYTGKTNEKGQLGFVKADGTEVYLDKENKFTPFKYSSKKQNVSKKAEENDGYITVWLWPGAGYLLNGFATQASSESEALDNVAQYLSDNNMGKYYETEEEHFNRIKEDNPDLSDEELFEIEHNDPTSIYVDNSMGFIGWINSENMKFSNGIDEQHIDQITIIDGPRKNASKQTKMPKKAWTELEKKQVGALEDKATGKYNIYQTNGGEIVLTNHKLDSKKYALMDTANTFEELVEKQEKNWEDSYTLYDKVLLPEFEKHFGVEIELDPDVENDTLENYNFFDLTKDYVEETKEAATNKKAENEDLIEVGWGLFTNDEYEIKDNALYGDDKPQEVNETFWNKINNEIDKVESWFLKEGYKQFFTKVRDEGHGKDSELGGTAWMTENQLKDFMANAEQWDTEFVLAESSGTLDFGNIPVDYNEALSFKLAIYVDDKDLDELGIESKKNIKNKKQSSKTNKLQKKATKTLEEVAGLIDTILDDFDHYDYADQLEVGEHSLYENILADLQKDEKKVIEGTLNYIAEDDSDEPFISKELVQLKEYYNNKFGKTATNKQAGNKVYIAKLYDKDGVKYDNIGKSENIDELKDLLRDWLFEKRKNRETNPKNNKFYLQDKIVIEDSNTGEPIETIKVSDLLSTYGRDYWKPFMEAKATKKKAVLQVSENGMGYVLPNGQVVYPGDEALLKSEKRANERMLEKDKKELERLEKIIAEYPDINFDKNPDSVKFQIPRLKKGIEYLELFNETIEDILNAFKENKLPRQATKKQAKKLEFEDDIVEVTDKKGKVIYEGMFDYLDYDMKEDFYDTAKTKWIGNKYKISLPNGEYYLKVKGHKNNKLDKQATIKHENGVYNVYSESGKCLGKGYKTKEEAEKRLKQVEYFKHKNASTLKVAKANLNGIIKVMDKMWHGNYDKNYVAIGKWGIGVGGYDTGYVISYDGNELFAITPDNVYDAWEDDEFVKELTGYTQNEIFQFIKDNYKHADLPNLDFNGSKIDMKSSKRTSLKQVEYFKNKKANKEDTYEEWGVLCNDLDEEWFDSETGAKIFFNKVKNKVDQVVHKVYDISNEEPEEIQVDVLYDKDRKINKLTMRTSLKQVVISKMATDLKDIPESVKKNVLSDLIYVILTGKGSFAYKTVAKKLETIIKDLGYGDKLKANEDGSLPTLEIVEQIAKEPKVMELAGKFANIAQIKASKKTIISKLAENEKIDWNHIWGIEYNGKKYMLHENMGTLYSFINMEDLKNNKITNKSYITFNMMQITKKVKEGKMLVIYDY